MYCFNGSLLDLWSTVVYGECVMAASGYCDTVESDTAS